MLYGAISLLLAIWLAAIAIVDWRSFRIPDVLSLPLIAVGLTGAAVFSTLPLWHHIIGAAAGYVVFWGIGEWYFRRTATEGLGLGDAKLFSAAGAWLGWQTLPFVLLIAAVTGLAFTLIAGRASRTSAIAFGPALAFGFLMLWLIRAPITIS